MLVFCRCCAHGLLVLSTPERLKEVRKRKDPDPVQLPWPSLQAHAEVALQLVLLSQRPERLEVLWREIFL